MMLLNSMCGILSVSHPPNPTWYLIQLLFLLPIYDNLFYIRSNSLDVSGTKLKLGESEADVGQKPNDFLASLMPSCQGTRLYFWQ